MSQNAEKSSQMGFIFEYFKTKPNQDIPHEEVVDWATTSWREKTGSVLRDPDRAIRKLHQQGYLVKVTKGVYRYDPDAVTERTLEDFTPQMKAQILSRDGYKCVVCGRGRDSGVELHVDHIKPKELGGRAELENGQTLCAQHNFQKKVYHQTESGKKMFIRLYELAIAEGDTDTKEFCERVLQVYEECGVNGHIEWRR